MLCVFYICVLNYRIVNWISVSNIPDRVKMSDIVMMSDIVVTYS